MKTLTLECFASAFFLPGGLVVDVVVVVVIQGKLNLIGRNIAVVYNACKCSIYIC